MMITSYVIPGSVKVIGANGQISLGKQYAGRQVLVEEHEPGVWLMRTATVVPDNELWLQHPDTARDLTKALTWAQTNPPTDDAVDAVLANVLANVLAKLNDPALDMLCSFYY